MKRARFSWIDSAAVLALAAAASLAPAAATPLRLEELAAVGAPAEGFPPGTVVQALGDAPSLDGDGNAAWVVAVRRPDGSSVQALYRRLGGATALVFSGGQIAPGTAQPFALFGTPRIVDGRLSFAASVGDRDGLWSDRFGAFERALLQGDALPGTPPGSGVFTFSLGVRGEALITRASFTRPEGNVPGDVGVWRNRTGSWDAVLVRGMAAPGIAGAVFEADPTRIFGPVFATATREDGSVLAQAWVQGRRIDGANDEGLWIERNGALQLLVREGARLALPGKVTFGPSGTRRVFGADQENVAPVMNAAGDVLFGALLRSSRLSWNSVWIHRAGATHLVARGGLPLEGFGDGDPAPGLAPGATFGMFPFGAIAPSGTIAFEAFADETGDFFALTEGIWWDDGGELALVAAQHRPAPGAGGASYGALTLEALTDDGTLYFTTRLAGTGVTAANEIALVRARPGGAAELVLREGDAVEVVDRLGNRSERTVAEFVFGRGVEVAGRAALRVGFRDGGSGLYRIDALP